MATTTLNSAADDVELEYPDTEEARERLRTHNRIGVSEAQLERMRKRFNWLNLVADQLYEITGDLYRLDLPILEYVLGQRYTEVTGTPIPEETAEELSRMTLDWETREPFRGANWSADPYRFTVRELRRMAARLNSDADKIEALERIPK